MDKSQIITELLAHHNSFAENLNVLSNEDFELKPSGKWAAGQQLDHIIKSVKPVDMAFGLPMFVLKMKFGLSNRPSKTYDDLVAKYQKALVENKGYDIPERFNPNEIPLKAKTRKLTKLKKLIEKLSSRLSRYTEDDLDTYILPHPLIGKLTLRKMLYFTIYHVQHHDKQIIPNLKSAKKQ